MKTLISLLFLFSFAITNAQDTIKLHWNSTLMESFIIVKTPCYCPPVDTVAILAKKCSTVVAPPVVIKDSIWRGIYINSIDKITGNKAKEDALIVDLKRWKYNSVHAYGLGSASATPLDLLMKRLRKETYVNDFTATGGDGSTFTGSRTNWNIAHSDSADFDGWNLEYEAYNAADVAAAWASNKVYLTDMKNGKAKGDVRYSIQYFGWWTKEPMKTETPSFLVKNTDWILLHEYTKQPSFSYMRSRCNDLESVGVPTILRPLFSAEPDFMQEVFKKIKPDSVYKIIKKDFDAMNYKNLKMDGYMMFHLDHLRMSDPTPTNNVFRMIGRIFKAKPDFCADDYENKTDSLHLLISIPPEE